MDSDTVDPGWDGEPVDNAFIFARQVHGGQLLYHSNKGGLARLRISASTRSGKCHGYKDVPTESEQNLTSTVAQQTVPIGIERDRSSFQSDMSGVIYAVRAYAPAENL